MTKNSSRFEPSIYDLRAERKTTTCEWCRTREGVERHHMLIHDLSRFHRELTVKENLMIACDYCHRGVCILDTYEMRQWFWSVQCARYGVDHMEDWLNSLPAKLWISGRVDIGIKKPLVRGAGVKITNGAICQGG